MHEDDSFFEVVSGRDEPEFEKTAGMRRKAAPVSLNHNSQRYLMGVPMVVEKEEETSDHCVYAFGAPDEMVGRVRLDTFGGDVELLRLSESKNGPSEKFYLAQIVPRLQSYHEQGTYPSSDRWEA